MRTESCKRGLISILPVLALVLLMTFAAVPVLAPAIISWPEGTMEVTPGENFTFRHRLRWDEDAPGYYIITIYWDYGGDNSWHFTLIENRAYFDDDSDNLPDPGVDPIEATADVTDNGSRYTLQVRNVNGDTRNGEFNVDLTLRASGPDGSPHRGGDHPISYVSIRCYEESARTEYPEPVTIRVLARGVAVAISPGSRSGPPGETLSYTVMVTNTGDLLDNYTLTANDNENWGLSLDNTRFEDVENGGSRSTTLSVTIPENAPTCTEDNITVRVTGTGVENSASCVAHALILRGVELAISPGYRSGSLGSALEYTVTVSNTGNVEDNYDLTASDNENWGPTVSPTPLTVPAGENGEATLSVTVPDNAEPCTEDNITVTATSLENAEISASNTCVAHAVLFLRGVELAISPSYQHGSLGSVLEYTITVSNTGNVEDNYDLTASDNENWGPTVSPTPLTVPAGENGEATLSVTVPENAEPCTEDNITVTATSQENSEISASDTCVAHAARVIYPIHDAYVWDAGVRRDNNYNTDNLKIGVEADFLIWTWLMFDLSEIPFGHRVENARLWLYFHDSGNGGSPGGIAAHFSDNDDWREDNITWNNMPLPSINPTATDNIPQFSDIGWKSLTLTQDVGRELDGDENVSWCLKSPENVLGDDRNIAHSKDYENALYHPYLEIVHVPVYRVSISILPLENSAKPGENVTFTVTVKNMGAFEDNYDLKVSDNENWGLTVTPALLTVPSGENRPATLSVTIPENATPCTRDNITVTATSQGDNTVNDNASCIAHAVIAPPKLLTPPDGTLTDNNTPTFRWENAYVADNYEIWVDNDPDFSSLVSGFPDNTAENFYVIEAPGLADENYSWKVRAYLGADVSDFSEVRTFIVDTTPPAKPNLAWPVDGENIRDNAPNLDWEKVEENALPVLYRVFISDNSEFPHENRPSPWVENDNWIVSPALPEGVWYWRVCARDNVGNVGENSDARSFRVDVTAPSAPTLLEPADGTTTSVNTPTFRWTAVTVEDSLPVTYDIEIDNDHNFASPENSATGLIDNTYTPSALADENYSWRVRAVDNAGNATWSSVWTLLIKTIVREVKVSISPSENSGPPGENVTFTVTVTNAGDVKDTYELTVYDERPLSWGAIVSPTSITIDAGASDKATLSVVVPPYAVDGELNIITIRAQSTGDPEVENFEDAYVRVTVQRNVNAFISPESQGGTPGKSLTYTVVVVNTGNVADNYALTVSDNENWGPTLSENSLKNVQPGENETATLSVIIPENAYSGAEDKITVTATSTENTKVSKSAICIATVTVVRGVEVSISPENKSGPPKGKLEYTVTIVNKGNAEDNYSLTVSDNENWGPTISPTVLIIPPNDNRTAKLNVIIPVAAENGAKDNVTVTATSQVENAVSDSASCIAQAFIVRGVGVSISPSQSSDVPGATLSYTVTVTNTGNVADNYALTISDNAVPSWNPTVSPTSLTIAAGGINTATLSVTIPSGAKHGERDNIRVVATSLEVSASASCEAEVSILRRVEVSISPGSRSGPPGTSLTYTVTVRNTGLIEDTYTLSVVEVAGWSVSIEPTSLTLAAGASDNATLSIVVPPDASEGTSITVNVRVKSEGDPTLIARDTCRTIVTGAPERPKVELPVPLAISVVLIGAAIIVPAYLLSVRPKKAARRRVLMMDYLLSVRPKKAARRRVLRDVGFSARGVK